MHALVGARAASLRAMPELCLSTETLKVLAEEHAAAGESTTASQDSDALLRARGLRWSSEGAAR